MPFLRLKIYGGLWYTPSMDEKIQTETAPGESGQDSAQNTEKYLIFTIQDKRYALPSKLINEVAAFEKVFPLPLLPDYVRGIINRYSIPYALIDIGFLLVKTPSGSGSPSMAKVIVLKEEVDKLAFLIDDVSDIADILPKDLLMVENAGEASEGGVAGFASSGLITATFDWKGSQIFCLGIGELIAQIKKEFEG
jgi:purine-binding chemotaxis protein CheW